MLTGRLAAVRASHTLRNGVLSDLLLHSIAYCFLMVITQLYRLYDKRVLHVQKFNEAERRWAEAIERVAREVYSADLLAMAAEALMISEAWNYKQVTHAI